MSASEPQQQRKSICRLENGMCLTDLPADCWVRPGNTWVSSGSGQKGNLSNMLIFDFPQNDGTLMLHLRIAWSCWPSSSCVLCIWLNAKAIYCFFCRCKAVFFCKNMFIKFKWMSFCASLCVTNLVCSPWSAISKQLSNTITQRSS